MTGEALLHRDELHLSLASSALCKQNTSKLFGEKG
jgi:hypothetical protein